MDENFGDVVSGHVEPRLRTTVEHQLEAVRGDITMRLIQLNATQKRWWPQ